MQVTVNELDARLKAIEARMCKVEAKADFSIRAHEELIGATTEIRGRVATLELKLDGLAQQMRDQFAAVDARFSEVDAKIDTLNGKFDALPGVIARVVTEAVTAANKKG